MAADQTVLDTLATNSQCCYVTKMGLALDAIRIGDPIWKQLWREAFYISSLIKSLWDYTLPGTCLSDIAVCDAINRLESACSSCCGYAGNSVSASLIPRTVPILPHSGVYENPPPRPAQGRT